MRNDATPLAASPLPRSWAGFRWESRYGALPPVLHRRQSPTPGRAPKLVMLNERLAEAMGLDVETLRSPDGAAFFAASRIVEGLEPLAQAYAGHQFGHFTILGDGRALLVGEHRLPEGGTVDVQWKGSGRTVFSRGGDGRLALGPALREFLISEAMAGLGIPTTRSLAVAATGESVVRESLLPGAVLTRVAQSHLRVGTFEWALVSEDRPALEALLDFAISRHDPAIDARWPAGNSATRAARAKAFFEAVIDRQTRLVASWMGVGFVHGVMNTDNTSISGETIDFGPCAFLDDYHPATVFSSIDHAGRYAYGQQPGIVGWNLARLGDTLLPFLGDTPEAGVAVANATLESFLDRFATHFTAVFGAKLGLEKPSREDVSLVQALFSLLERERSDFHRSWIVLTESVESALRGEPVPAPFAEWSGHWLARLREEGRRPEDVAATMRRANPRMIPRNHRVEEALARASEGDFAPYQRLLDAVSVPYEDSPAARELGAPPAVKNPHYQTFCGT